MVMVGEYILELFLTLSNSREDEKGKKRQRGEYEKKKKLEGDKRRAEDKENRSRRGK